MLVRFLEGIFSQQYSTFIVDYRTKQVYYNKTRFWLSLYDTAGTERYKVIVNNYFVHSRAALIVFDINEEKTLDNARKWLEQFSMICDLGVPKLLLANKCDKMQPDELERTLLEFGPKIEALKKDFNCEFFAVSCKDGMNIDNAFDYLVKTVYEKYVCKEILGWSDINLGNSGKHKPSRCF